MSANIERMEVKEELDRLRDPSLSTKRCAKWSLCGTICCLVSILVFSLAVSGNYEENFGKTGRVIPHPANGDDVFTYHAEGTLLGKAVDWYRFNTVADGSVILDAGNSYRVQVCNLDAGVIDNARDLDWFVLFGSEASVDEASERLASYEQFHFKNSTACFSSAYQSDCTQSIYVGVRKKQPARSTSLENEPYNVRMTFSVVKSAGCGEDLDGMLTFLYYSTVALMSVAALAFSISSITAWILYKKKTVDDDVIRA